MMVAQERFSKEYKVELVEVRDFNKLGELYATVAVHECNGDIHPSSKDKDDKDENARLWGEVAEGYGQSMLNIVQGWGFDGLDFGVGLYPTLRQGNCTVHFPWN